MDDPGLVGLVERVGELPEQGAHVVGRHGPLSLAEVLQALALQELHGEERRAERLVGARVEHLHDVGVVPDPCPDLRFADEQLDELGARDEVGMDDLQGARLSRAGVTGQVDPRHPTLAEDTLHAIPAADRVADTNCSCASVHLGLPPATVAYRAAQAGGRVMAPLAEPRRAGPRPVR